MIFSFKDSKASHNLTIVSVLLLQVTLTTNIFSPIDFTRSCRQAQNQINFSQSITGGWEREREREEETIIEFYYFKKKKKEDEEEKKKKKKNG